MISPPATLRRAAAFSGAAMLALACAPWALLPQAQAGTCGDFSWGLRDSFRSYLTGPIAHGSFDLSGVGDNGKQFLFDVNSVDVASDTEATLKMPGTLRFSGHEGLLDTTLSDWKIRVNGNDAEILVDFDAAQVNPETLQASGRESGDDVPLVRVSLRNTPNFSSSSVDLSGTTTLTAEGANIMSGFYDPGAAFADTSGSINPKCSGSSASTTSGTTSTAGASGNAQELKINEWDSPEIRTIKELNNVIFATGMTYESGTKAMNNAEKFLETFRGSAPASTAQGAPQSVQVVSDATGANDSVPAVPDVPGVSTQSAAPQVTAPSQPTAAGQLPAECAEGDVKAVANSAMRWGVKSSFLTYISGSIAKGAWAMSNTTYDQGQFTFTGSRGAVNTSAKSGTIGYTGGVRFSGHGGTLDLMIANPEIVFNGNRGTLQAQVRSSDMSGTRTDFGTVAIADLAFSSLQVSDSQVVGTTSSVTLTQAGAQAFSSFYEPGSALAPLSFNAALGGSADCAAANAPAKSGSAIPGVATTSPEQAKADAAVAESAEIAAPQLKSGEKKSQFAIKNSAQESEAMDPVTAGLLVAAGFLVAGGAISSFALRNPA